MTYEAFPTDFAPSELYHEASSQPLVARQPISQTILDAIGFTAEDLIWSAALWLAAIGLAPFVIFYVLMIN